MAYSTEITDIFIHAEAAPVPFRDGYLTQAPFILPVVAADFAKQSRGEVRQGRYIKALGEVIGKPILQMQDTSYTGAPGGPFTGMVFDLGGAGTAQWRMWRDADLYDTWGILLPANESSTERTLTENATRMKIDSYAVLLRRWWPVGVTLTSSTWYTTVELAYNSEHNFRVRASWGEPIVLEFTKDSGASWKIVAEATLLGNTEQYLQQNDYLLRINFLPDPKRKTLVVEIGDGNFLTFAARDRDGYDFSDTESPLSSYAQFRVRLRSGAASLHVLPVEWSNPSVRMEHIAEGAEVATATEVYIRSNALSPDKDDGVTASASTDGEKFTIELEQDAAAIDGVPRLTDALLIIPSYWTFGVPGGVEVPTSERLASMQVVETQIWDDARRFLTTSGRLVCNNRTALYTGAYRRRALDLWASVDNGDTLYKRLTGVIGIGPGMTVSVNEGVRRLALPFGDNAVKMMRPLGHELMLDGWALSSAVRYLLERGNIDWTRFGDLFTPAFYVPPDVPFYAPYGPAGDDIPDGEIVLGQGTGNNPRYVFGPEMSPFQVLQALCQDTSDVFGNPFYMGFDVNGQFHFEAFVPENLEIALGFASDPNNALLNLLLPALPLFRMNHVAEVENSTEQMRSELTFQGVDGGTYELLTRYRKQPPSVLEDMGWTEPWYERQGRWSSDAYLDYLLDGAQIASALPLQTIQFYASFHPGLTAGMKIAVEDVQTVGASPRTYIITHLTASYGMADILGDSPVQLGEMHIVARWTGNYLP